jgi:hypothetical protein
MRGTHVLECLSVPFLAVYNLNERGFTFEED